MHAPVPLDEASLPGFLRRAGLLADGTRVAVEPAGDGNINWVRRVRAGDGRSWIVKQARPALERFPEYRVTPDRILFEARYYETVRPWDDEKVLPEVLHFDGDARVLVLEDLGPVTRLDHALLAGSDGRAPVRRLARFLGRVHAASAEAGLAGRFENHEMRRLHGDHIFDLPFHPNDFPLPPQLRCRAEALWQDRELVELAAAAYQRYATGPEGVLVHADVQAGNVLLAPRAKLLDAEIAHVGDAAFDLGTLLAHVLLPACARGSLAAARSTAAQAWEAYREAWPAGPPFADVARYAGIEMVRRSVGAARVAAVEAQEPALAALGLGTSLIRNPPRDPRQLGG